MMTMKDMDALNRAHDAAVRNMGNAAVIIAETVSEGRVPTEGMLRDYHFAKLGVQSTRRDLENCVSIELCEILDG